MYQRWYTRKLKENKMPLPGSKREKKMLAELQTNEAPAPRARTRVRPAFLQEVVEPEVQVEENAEVDTEEE